MADDSLNLSNLDVSKLKVPDLKKELKQRGLSSSGNKTELVERLQSALKSSASGESIDDIEEDLLNDDDDEHMDGSESVINEELENDLADSPDSLKTGEKRKVESSDVKHLPLKKVILNRNITVDSIDTPKTEVKDSKSVDEKSSEEDKKVVKLSELSVKERLEMRAKKFGANSITALSDDVKKAARAERFGSSVANGTNTNTKIVNNVNTDVETLKKRAARFGQSVSSVMTDLEKQEALEKRKQRFGLSTNTSNSSSYEDKAKARLERFKQPGK